MRYQALLGMFLYFGVLCSAQGSSTMRVSNGMLLDAQGQPFVMRGVNLQYGDRPFERLASIAPIASLGANTIRLELREHTTAAQLAAALDAIIARKMVAMVFYWEKDVTCTGATPGFEVGMARWTNTWKDVLLDPRYQKHLMLNIANEWGGKGTPYSVYEESYVQAISRLRAVGFQFPLVIDAPDCGQNVDQLVQSAPRFQAADPLGNTLLSLHAYWRYQDAHKITAAMNDLDETGMAWLWGEVPYGVYQQELGHNTDHASLLQQAQERGVGWLAWSWHGNGSQAEKVLDMSSQADAIKLGPWGQVVVNGPHGLAATAKALGY